MSTCQEMYQNDIRSPYLLGFIIDMYEEMLEANSNDKTPLPTAIEVSIIIHNSRAIEPKLSVQIIWY